MRVFVIPSANRSKHRRGVGHCGADSANELSGRLEGAGRGEDKTHGVQDSQAFELKHAIFSGPMRILFLFGSAAF